MQNKKRKKYIYMFLGDFSFPTHAAVFAPLNLPYIFGEDNLSYN